MLNGYVPTQMLNRQQLASECVGMRHVATSKGSDISNLIPDFIASTAIQPSANASFAGKPQLA